MEVRFLILGEVAVEVDASWLPFESMMLRALLAALLLQPNRFLSPPQLMLALWDTPPASAESNLRTYATRLRRALSHGGEALAARLGARRGSGYRMEIADGELDHQTFRSLATAGRGHLLAGDLAIAADLLSRALAMWRGSAGHDLPPHGYATRQLRALNESRLIATEDLMEARLALGDTMHLVSDLQAHIALYPLRERAYGQLMRALYHGGGASTALAVYDRLRAVLRTDLGIEPGPELQLLHRAVLRHDREELSTPRVGYGTLAA